jgi:hypothetical protein
MCVGWKEEGLRSCHVVRIKVTKKGGLRGEGECSSSTLDDTLGEEEETCGKPLKVVVILFGDDLIVVVFVGDA